MTAADSAFVHTNPNILRQIYFQNLEMNNEKLNFRHPFPCCFVLFHHTHFSHVLCGLSVPVLLGAALWSLTARELPFQAVAPEWQSQGAKYVTAAGGNGAGMSEETEFTSEMKSSEKSLCPSAHFWYAFLLILFAENTASCHYFLKNKKKYDCRLCD